MENLLPFWTENYFRHSSYLKIDNKPLLFIYRPEFLVQDLGGVDKVRAALDKMRAACRKAGFAGLYILGEYRGLDPKHLKLMKQLGLDYTFAYCWHVQGNPSPEQAIAAQLDYIDKTRRMGILPEVVTVSQGWSGWQDEGSIWKIPPRAVQGVVGKGQGDYPHLPGQGAWKQDAPVGQLERVERRPLHRSPPRIWFRLPGRSARGLLRCPEEPRRFVAQRRGHGTV